MKTDIFQSCGHCWVFQICWHIECNTLTTSYFSVWNSSTGIPSHPLALFIVILPKAHWLCIPGCLGLGEWSHHHGYLGYEDLFCIDIVFFLPPLLNIFSFCWVIPFLSFIEPIFAWNVPLGEKRAFRMGENNSKWSNWQRINLKNIQAAPAAQCQKNKWPNQKMGQRTKQTRRHTDG